METLSRVHARNLVSFARDRKDVLVLSADLTSSCEADLFRDAYPERFVSAGIAEQNMLSVAGGLAREGFVPFVHTFAVFIARRAFDQVAMSVAYPDVDVKMLGFLPGITTPGGATHQAIEDAAVMRALPNMTVLEVGDATEVEGVLDLAYRTRGPVYVRMLRGDLPRLFDPAEPIAVDRPRVLARGEDVVVVSSGICTGEAMRAVAALAARGLRVGHVHVSTLKPFDSPLLRRELERAHRGVVTVENHTVLGGLGTLVAERMVEWGVRAPLLKLGLQDTFANGASRRYLMRRHGLDALAVARTVERLSGATPGIAEADLAEVRIEPVHSLSRPEAL